MNTGGNILTLGGNVIGLPTNGATTGTIQSVAGGVTSVPITSGGTNYTVAPSVSFSGGGGGSGAAGYALVSGGVVTAIIVTNPGSGYTSAPTAILSGGVFTTAATLGVVTIGTNGGVRRAFTVADIGPASDINAMIIGRQQPHKAGNGT